jgi:hypothetical protein
VPVAELDVESEIYERLYGLPRREQHNGGPAEHPIVIVDGAIGAGTGAGETTESPVRPRSSGRRMGRTVPLGRELNRLGGEVLEAAAAAALWARNELPPTVDAASSAVRRRPVIAGAVAAAVIALPLAALLLSADGSSTAARARLATPLAPQAALGSAPAAAPRTAPRRSSPPPPTDTAAQASAGPVGGTATGTTAIQPRPSKARVLRHRTATRQPKRTAPRPPRPAPIRQPTSRERPPQRPTTGTTPVNPPAGTGPTNTTGGQPAPAD